MVDAAHATSAAPTYFEPVRLGARTLVDGGVFAINPAMFAYAEVAAADARPAASLGTGSHTRPLPYEKVKDWGKLEWAAADHRRRLRRRRRHRRRSARARSPATRYVRLQTRLDEASDDLDDAAADNLAALRHEAERLIADRDADIDRAVRDAHGLTAFTAAERPDLTERADFAGAVWPEYNLHGDVMNAHWPRLGSEFADFQFVLADADEDVVAQGHTIPCRWDGTAEGLPGGIDGVIATGAADRGEHGVGARRARAARPPGPGARPRRARDDGRACRRHGLGNLIAPVRPSPRSATRSSRSSATPPGRAPTGCRSTPGCASTRGSAGGSCAPSRESLRITGTVAEWESWTGLALPESGVYVFPHGLAPLAVDREDDVGALLGAQRVDGPLGRRGARRRRSSCPLGVGWPSRRRSAAY